jgi:transposase
LDRNVTLLPISSRPAWFYFGIIAIEDLNVKALARGLHARAVHDAAFGEIRRQLIYKSGPAGRVLLEVPRYFASSKTCSVCGHGLDELRLDQREWTCPKCGTCHDRDVNAARVILHEAMCRIAGRDDRDLRVDASDTCPEDFPSPVQVLADEARSAHRD